MNQMFCFQCEQTAGGRACTGNAGVCGKSAQTANRQDKLTAALIELARAAKSNRANVTRQTYRLVKEGLFATVTNVNFNTETVEEMCQKINRERYRIEPAGEKADVCSDDCYNLNRLWQAQDNIRSLKSLILLGLRGMAAYAYHAAVLGYNDKEVDDFFFEGLQAIKEETDRDTLLSLVLKTGQVNFKCMELLDRANTSTYGNPVPTKVTMTIEKGPFIVVSGHDLYALEQILKQTEGKGINIYTHSEMLPAHGYPELKKYSHLKGNFGTAWYTQQREFIDIPAPVVFTTNCLMPLRENYADRIYSTEVVSYPGMVHIGKDLDFTPVIEKSLELGGYKEDKRLTGINGGDTVYTGFARNFVSEHSGEIVNLVKQGKIKHFFLVGGCDGARPGRNYYTEFVKNAPKDSIILTLACGKYRFNDIDLGEIEGLPRIMDMGQCNDAYSAITVALALADAFGCGVNELPLTMVLSWYEQKAVCILLTLLYLGVKNIFLGPSLPAFISPDILKFLSENYNLTPISTPEEDLKKILG